MIEVNLKVDRVCSHQVMDLFADDEGNHFILIQIRDHYGMLCLNNGLVYDMADTVLDAVCGYFFIGTASTVDVKVLKWS